MTEAGPGPSGSGTPVDPAAAGPFRDLPILDPGVIAELRRGLGEAALRDLLRLFPVSAAGEFAELSSARAEGDAGRLRRAAHTLKGVAGNFGATRLAAFARAAEAAAADPVALDALLPAMAGALAETSAAMGEV